MTAQQIAAPLARLWQGFEHAMQQRAMRQALARLDDHMLQDLGISRAQAAFEADAGRAWWQSGARHDA